MAESKSKIALEGNYQAFEEEVIIELFADEPVSFNDFVEFIYKNFVEVHISDFVGKRGVKNVVVNFRNHENKMHPYKSSINWTSEENIKKDLGNQVQI